MKARTLAAATAAVTALFAADLVVAPVASASGPSGPSGATVEVVVVGDAALSPTEVAAATGGAGRIASVVGAIGATVVEVPAGSASASIGRLDRLPGVDTAYRPHDARAFDVTPNDPNWFRQDSLRAIRTPTAWTTSTGSSSVVIAVVDSGVTETADLAGRVLPGIDLVNDDNDPSDDAGHGTDTALVAAAAGNDAAGAAGMCWSCKILPVKVLDANGSGSMADVAAGVVWATDHGADVINLSLGGPFSDAAVSAAVRYAQQHDVVIVASAGNDGTDQPNYPAADPGVIAVAGSTLDDPAPGDSRTLWYWSQRGPTWVDVAAPGCNWVVDDIGPFQFCGTSAAAPVVTGLAALLRAVRPGADRNMVATAIVTTAEFAPTKGLVGYGIVDAASAVGAIGSVQPGPVPPPPDVTAPDVFASAGSGYLSGFQWVGIHASDDQSLQRVELWVDSVFIGATAPTGDRTDIGFDTRAFGDGRHLVRAVAVDGVGHAAEDSLLITTDNANPLGILVSPTWGSTVSGSFVARAFVTDPNGIMGTFLIANDKVVGGFVGSGWGQATVPVRSSGTIRVVAITVDNAGRISGTNMAVVRGVVPRRRR